MDELSLPKDSQEFIFSQKAKERTALCMLVLFAMVTLFVLFLVWSTFAQAKEISVSGKAVSQGEIMYSIDSLEVSNTVDIAGWAFEPGVPLPYADCFVLLKDLASSRYYQMKTVVVSRADLNEHFDTKTLELSGFRARTSADQLDPTTTYQIYLLYFDKLVETNQWFSLSDYTE